MSSASGGCGSARASSREATTGTWDRPGIGRKSPTDGGRLGRVDDRDHFPAAVPEHPERGLGGVVTEGALGEDDQPLRRRARRYAGCREIHCGAD